MLECDFILPAGMDGRSILLPRDDRGERISVYDGAGGQNTDNGDGTKTYHMSLSAPEQETSSLTFEIIEWPFEGDDPTVIGTYTLELDSHE